MVREGNLYKFGADEILKAKILFEKEYKDARQNNQKQIFDDEDSWSGKLGEKATSDYFPTLIKTAKDFGWAAVDFTNSSNTLGYDVKTKNGNFPYSFNFDSDINEDQFLVSPNNIYIGCYYQLDTGNLWVVGWIWKKDVESLGKYQKKGDLYHDRYKIIANRWAVQFSSFNSLESMPL